MTLDPSDNAAEPPAGPAPPDRAADGLACLERGELEAAATCFRAALAADAKDLRALLGLGRVLEARGKPALAILQYQTAASLQPGSAEAFVRLGDLYISQGKDKAALAAYDRALRADPRSSLAHYHEALTLLAQGSYGRGWRGFEWRWRAAGASRPDAGLPLWDGKARDGLRLLVEGEGTPAEAIFYSHALGDLMARGVELHFRGDPGFAALLRRSCPRLAVMEPGTPLPPLDAAVALGSLPGFFRRRTTDFKRPSGYLLADLRATTRWRERYRALGVGPMLGLAWRGDCQWPARQAPELPPAALAPLLAIPALHGVSLESLEAEETLFARAPELGLACWPEAHAASAAASDLDELAARIDATDLVVAVPGLVAALAGALGKPVFVLAPPVAGWLWLLRGRKLPWFPTMNLTRLRSDQGWAAAIAMLAARLEAGMTGEEPPPRVGA